MAVMTRHNAHRRTPNRILIVLAAAWIAVSLAIGGWVMPDDERGAAAQAAAAGRPHSPEPRSTGPER